VFIVVGKDFKQPFRCADGALQLTVDISKPAMDAPMKDVYRMNENNPPTFTAPDCTNKAPYQLTPTMPPKKGKDRKRDEQPAILLRWTAVLTTSVNDLR